MSRYFRTCCRLGFVLLAALTVAPLVHAQAAEAPAPEVAQAEEARHEEAHGKVFAIINGQTVPTDDYESAFESVVRQRFFHGRVPEGALAAIREEIKQKLVQRIVLLEEAKRRNIVADEAVINEALAGYEQRFTNDPLWQQHREELIPELRRQLAEQSLVYQLDKQVRDLPVPSEAEVRAHYDNRPDLFTEPEKFRLSVILFAVDPSSPVTAWDTAREQAKEIHGRLLSGDANFNEMARLHSSVFAEEAGDMGYLHRGMLPEQVQEKVDGFEVGKINEPLKTLEGIAIFQLTEREQPKKRDFADVADRARELLVRDRKDAAWEELIGRLVAKADVRFMYSFANGTQAVDGK